MISKILIMTNDKEIEYLYLKPIHQRILDLLVMGYSHKEIAQKLGINVGTLYSYIRDMNFNNDCNIYQLIWNYAQLGDKYAIKPLLKHSKYMLKGKVRKLKWFKDRVGKRVFRNESSCKCSFCTFNQKNGLIINDETHAQYLFDIQNELQLKYYDAPKTKKHVI
jgi:hypothetical protein